MTLALPTSVASFDGIVFLTDGTTHWGGLGLYSDFPATRIKVQWGNADFGQPLAETFLPQIGADPCGCPAAAGEFRMPAADPRYYLDGLYTIRVTATLADGSVRGEVMNAYFQINATLGFNHAGTGRDDLISGGFGGDTLDGGGGDDWVFGGQGGDLLLGRSGDDVLGGGDGTGADSLHGGNGGDLLAGDGGNDLLLGERGDDGLFGGDGDDTLLGGSEADALLGDAGDDSLDGGTGDDLGTGGAGADTLLGGDGFDLLFGDDGNDSIAGGTGNDWLVGGSGNDRLFGNADDDLLHGDAGDDTLNGSLGDDELDGGAGQDSMSGGDGYDTLFGDTGNDTQTGGAGDDTLFGGDGADRQVGGTGADEFDGGLGADILLSQADGEVDVFVYYSLAEGADLIGGFEAGIDRLLLYFGEIDAAHFVTSPASMTDASTWFIYNAANGQLRIDENGTEAGGSGLLAILAGAPALSHGDFIFAGLG